MSEVAGPPAPPAATASRVSAAPVATGGSGQHQTPAQSGRGGEKGTAAAQARPDAAVILSPSLAHYVPGDDIAARVIGHGADGMAILQTPNGVFVATSGENLPVGAEIVLRVAATGGDHIRALLIAMDGVDLPPREMSLVLVQVSAAMQRIVPVATQSAPPPLAEGRIVTARVLALPSAQASVAPSLSRPVPAAAAADGAAEAWRLAAGAVLRVRVLALGNGGPTAPVATAPAPHPGAAIAVPAAGPSIPVETGDAVRPVGTAARAVSPNAGTATAAPGEAAPGVAGGTAPAPVLSGVLAAQGGSPIVATQAGTLVIEAARGLPEGTRILLEILDEPPLPAPAPASSLASATAGPGTSILDLARDWPALRDVLTSAAQSAPATVAQFVHHRIPTFDSRAAARMLFFLAALRSGDVAGWLGGDIVRTLERSGQRGILDRLGDDFRQLRRLGDDAGASDWRLLLFPFSDGERVDPVRMFVRGQKRQRGRNDSDLRFIVDVRLSALGAIQLDGLLRAKSLDLIVRSHKDLTPQRRDDIARIFAEGLETIGYKGGLSFQTVRTFPVSPLHDLIGGARDAGAVVA